MLRKIIILTVLGGFLVSHSTEAQDVRTDSVAVVSESVPDTVSKPVLMLDGKPMTEFGKRRIFGGLFWAVRLIRRKVPWVWAAQYCRVSVFIGTTPLPNDLLSPPVSLSP